MQQTGKSHIVNVAERPLSAGVKVTPPPPPEKSAQYYKVTELLSFLFERFRLSFFPVIVIAGVCVAEVQAQTRSTWTFTPELRQLDATPIVDRSRELKVGLYVNVSTDGEGVPDPLTGLDPDAVIGFQALNAFITFTGLAAGLATTGSFENGLNPATSTLSDSDLMTPTTTGSEYNVIYPDPLDSGTGNTGAWCTPAPPKSGSCDIFVGTLTVPLTALADEASGTLSLTPSLDERGTFPIRFRAEDEFMPGNTVVYQVCPVAGCPVSVDFGAADYSVIEGGTVDGTVDVEVELGGPLNAPVIVPIRVSTGAGTTASPGDYMLPDPLQVTFPAGSTSGTVRLTAVDNDEDAVAEMITVALEFGATLPPSVVPDTITATTVTITDDDHPAVEVNFGAGNYQTSEGGAPVIVTVTLTAEPEREVRIPIIARPAGGADSGDFSGVPAMLTFAPDATSQTFGVSAFDDAVGDTGESLGLEFGVLPDRVTRGTIANTSVALLDNDSDTITLSASATSLAESAGSAVNITLTAELDLRSSFALGTAVSVPITILPSGTAIEDIDYSHNNPTITLPMGSMDEATAMATLTLTPMDDAIVEATETIDISGTVAGYAINRLTIELTDSDTASLSITGPGTAVSEGGAAEFAVTLSAPVDAETLVAWTASDGTAATVADDLDQASGSLTFPAAATGTPTRTISVTAVDDDLSEGPEDFTLALGTVTGTFAGRITPAPAAVTAMIAASDPLTVSLEGPGRLTESVPAVYTLRVAGGISTADIIANLAIGAATTATADDYDGFTSSITIPARMETRQFTINIKADAVSDADEILEIELTSVSGGSGTTSVSTTANSVSLPINEALMVSVGTPNPGMADEGGTFIVPVMVDETLPAGVELTVTYQLNPGAAPGAADANDYRDPGGGSLTIGAGQSSGNIELMAVNDNLSEGAENFMLTLTGVTSGDPANPAVLVSARVSTTPLTIAASDPLTLSLDGPDIAREGRTAQYTLRLDGGVDASTVGATIIFDSAASTASSDDFTGLPAVVTITGGQTGATFAVEIVKEDGNEREGEELLVLRIDPATLTGSPGGGLSVAAASSVETTLLEIDIEQRDRAAQSTLAAFGRTLSSDLVGIVGERVAIINAGQSRLKISETELSATDLEILTDLKTPEKVLGTGNTEEDETTDDYQETLNRFKQLTGFRAYGNTVTFDLSSLRELLPGSEFNFNLSKGDAGTGDRAGVGGGGFSLWGRGAVSHFDGQPHRGFEMDGEVLSGQVGIDYMSRRGLLFGLAANYSEGDTDYNFTDGTLGDIDTQLTSVHPYLHYAPTGSALSSWLMLGYGFGDMTLTDDSGDPVETDIDMKMGAIGFNYDLPSTGGVDWALKTDTFFTRLSADEQTDLLSEVEADSYQARLRLAANTGVELDENSKLTGGLDLGGRWDGGDAETGAGAEVGGGLDYTHMALGLNASLKGRYLLAHQESALDEWGASFSVALNPSGSGHGLNLSIAQTLGGSAHSGADSLWENSRTLQTLADGAESSSADDDEGNMAIEGRLGYGFGFMRDYGLLTPYSALGRSDGRRLVKLGTSLKFATPQRLSLLLDLYGERRDAREQTTTSLMFDSRVRQLIGDDFGSLDLFGRLGASDRAATDRADSLEVGMEFRADF